MKEVDRYTTVERLLQINPTLIAYECSNTHIHSVLEDLVYKLKQADELRNEVLSLNANCNDIGEGKLKNLIALAEVL